MSHKDQHGAPQGRAGEWALSSGIVGLVGSVVPVVGEVVAAPASLLAVGLGLLGLRQYETRRADHVVPAVVGTILGGLGLALTIIVVVAMHV
ncbi:hypothetical protein J4G33_00930 [Actinotalea sp. BY-33]|uniref:DUF4190 domain-containing protein n=1 Tax=Actinotalea soli TaxID=2819234 RepID=A0A939LMS2_9CELL|nr:hypothetical protein [Actinotalea soli]MBO1750361.1 hypothetical protein [Actinotalea soli]